MSRPLFVTGEAAESVELISSAGTKLDNFEGKGRKNQSCGMTFLQCHVSHLPVLPRGPTRRFKLWRKLPCPTHTFAVAGGLSPNESENMPSVQYLILVQYVRSGKLMVALVDCDEPISPTCELLNKMKRRSTVRLEKALVKALP